MEQTNEESYIYQKTYECPICGKEIKSISCKTSKLRLVRRDVDLRVVYNGVDVEKYAVVVCDKCGYATLENHFGKLTEVEKSKIASEITPIFKYKNKTEGVYTYIDAIQRYSLAIANAVARHANFGESAYLCLKYAWLFRGAIEHYSLEGCGMLKNELVEKEKLYLEKAYAGFSTAIVKENFPICGMDSETMDYLLAALAYKNDDKKNAKDCISRIISNKNASNKIKDKAFELKNIIKEEEEKGAEDS